MSNGPLVGRGGRWVSWFGVTAAVARRPDLWPTGLRMFRSMVDRHWWRRPPFVPVPAGDWVRFRTITAYGGDGSAPPRAHDVVTWLEWCRRFPG